MPTIKRTVELAAGESATPFAGSQYEFLPFIALTQFALLADGDDVEGSIFTGSDVLLEPSELDTRALAEPILFPDDVLVEDIVGGGERINATVRNNSGVTRTVRAVVRITPRGR